MPDAAPTPEVDMRGEVIVSFVRAGAASLPVSRYGDDVWELTEVTTNACAGRRRMNFLLLPAQFRDITKSALYIYRRDGRRNRKPPTDAFVIRVFMNLVSFMRYLDRAGVESLSHVTELTCLNYVNDCREHVTPNGKPLSNGTVQLRLFAVEILHDTTKDLPDGLKAHPWPSTSAQFLAGVVGSHARMLMEAKTQVIPEPVLIKAFQSAESVLKGARALLQLRDELASGPFDETVSARTTCTARNQFLVERGWSRGLREFHNALKDIRTACYIVIAVLSGCRNHELAFMQRGAVRAEVKNGERYWWIRSRSSKTYVGACEWMVPVAAVEAVRIAEWWARPYQAQINKALQVSGASSLDEAKKAELSRHKDAIFLGRRQGQIPTTLDVSSWGLHFASFARRHGLDWQFSSHQFRRTFAVIAAKSHLGDLRYLRDHFKHWSMDMTLMYALHDGGDHDLISEIAKEIDGAKEHIVAGWLSPNMPLAGGAGKRLKGFRDENPVRMYKSHVDMVKTISRSVHIRSNGHAWCTADKGDACVGNTAIEATRCSLCENAVITADQAPFYERTRRDLAGLLELKDIGEAGRERVRRDIARCEVVLKELRSHEK